MSTLRVVGFHGVVGANQTPAVRGPVIADPAKADALDWTCGTQTPSWMPRAGHVVLVLGRREVAYMPKVLVPFPAVHGNTVIWYCSSDQVRALKTRVARVARRELASLLSRLSRRRQEVVRAAFWLSRTAVEDVDLRLASRALKQAGHACWELVAP